MARFARRIPPSHDLLAAFEAVGGRRDLGGDLGFVCRTIIAERSPGLERSFRRCIICTGKKGGDCVGPTKRGKGTKWMVVVDGQGIPVASRLASASPAEVKLIEGTLDRSKVDFPFNLKLVLDRAYDSDPLRNRLRERWIQMVCPHRKGRKRKPSQDGRSLRRYKRRWKVERTFAWLGWFRRLIVRHENILSVYQGFFHIALALIAFRFL